MEYRETSVTRYSHKAMHFCRALWKITSDRIYAVKQIRVRDRDNPVRVWVAPNSGTSGLE